MCGWCDNGTDGGNPVSGGHGDDVDVGVVLMVEAGGGYEGDVVVVLVVPTAVMAEVI